MFRFGVLFIRSSHYKLAHPRLIHETIGEDTLVINLDNGYYYSLRMVASSVWNYLAQGIMLEEIQNLICRDYEIDKSVSNSEIQNFILELVAEGLISEDFNPPEQESKNSPQVAVVLRKKYHVPLLEKYMDMEALLLADPIHEFVDE